MNRFFMRKTGLCVALGCLLLGAGASALDAATEQYQKRLDGEVKKINQRYDDVQKELDEEFVSIAKERDKSGAAIADSVKVLEQKRADSIRKFDENFRKFEDNMRAANIPASDKRYVDAAQPLNADRESIDRTYESSLATLQQLYQLNSKRFSELMKVHNARESIEAARHREERAMAMEYARREVRDGATDADKRAARLREQEYQDQRQAADTRYNASLNALDEYRNLVNARIEQQNSYLSDYAAIMQDLNRTDITPANRADYAERLARLNVRKDAEERQYQNNALFIEEKLTFEQMRGREMARAAEDRRQIEEAWFKTDENYRGQLASLEKDRDASGLSSERKKTLEERIARLNERHSAERESYRTALKNVDERQKLMRQAMDDRMSYLESRNDIRLDMAKQPMTEESFDKYRGEIARLEERRISGERDIRDKLASLVGSMPSAYRVASVHAMDPQMRRERVVGRIDGMKSAIENNWKATQARLNGEADAIVQKLMASDLTEAERKRLESERASLNKRMGEAQEHMARAVEKLEGRKALEEKRMAATAEYVAKRNALRDGFKLDTAQYNDVDDFEKRLADLDKEFARQEQEYFEQIRGIDGAVLPGASPMKDDTPNPSAEAVKAADRVGSMAAMAVNDTEPDPGKPAGGAPTANRSAAVVTVNRANAPVGASAGDRGVSTIIVAETPSGQPVSRVVRGEYREERENFGEEVKGAWETVKEKVADSYHRAVDYLRD